MEMSLKRQPTLIMLGKEALVEGGESTRGNGWCMYGNVLLRSKHKPTPPVLNLNWDEKAKQTSYVFCK